MKLLAIIADTLRSRLSTNIAFLSISTFFLIIGVIAALLVDPSTLLNSGQSGPQGPRQQGGQTQQAPRGTVGNPGPQGQQPGQLPPAQDPTQPSDSTMAAQQQAQLFLDLSTIPKLIDLFEAGLASFVHFAALLLAVFATAGIVPGTLEKGSIDLFLSKPVSRTELLTGRYLGGGLIVFLNTAYFVLGAWLIISIKTGYWNAPFLAAILTVTVSYLVLAGVMMVLGVTLRSSAFTIIIVFFFIYLVAPFLASREGLLFHVIQNQTLKDAITGVYYLLPKPGGFTDMAGNLIMRQKIDWMPVWSSVLFGVAAYAIAVAVFRKKDF